MLIEKTNGSAKYSLSLSFSFIRQQKSWLIPFWQKQFLPFFQMAKFKSELNINSKTSQQFNFAVAKLLLW